MTTTQPRDRLKRQARLSRVLMVLAGIFYASFITEALLGFPLDPTVSYLSEYTSQASPVRPLFVATDLASSALVFVGAVVLYRAARGARGGHAGARRWSWVQWIVAVGVVGSAAATVFDSFSPMRCAESLPHCPVAEELTRHDISSSLAGTFQAVLAVGAILWFIRRMRWVRGVEGARTGVVRAVAAAAGVLFIVTTAVLMYQIEIQRLFGLGQRVQTFLAAVLIGLSGFILSSPSRTAGGRAS